MTTVSVVFQMIAFQSDYVLEPVLAALLPYGKVIATEGPVRYWQERGCVTSSDQTLKILQRRLGIENVVSGIWEEKDKMMNAALHLIPPETTHVWMVDADEYYPPALIVKTLATLDQYDSVNFLPLTFFGGFAHVLGGFERTAPWTRIQRWHVGARWQTHRPPTILAPDGKPYRQHRPRQSGEEFYHYSYVFPQQVKNKVEYYNATMGGVIPNYFQEVWLQWVLGDEGERRRIELKYDGVHEWLPARRGACFPSPFEGKHPPAIAERLPELRQRFNEELTEVRA